MSTLTLALLLGAMSAGAAWADAPKRRVPVDVRLVGDDGLTQNLSASLQEGLRSHQRLRLTNSSDEAAVTIRSKSNVGWDKLGGRNVVIYTVYVSRGGAVAEPVTGVCYERAMSKCVKDILRIAYLEADRPSK